MYGYPKIQEVKYVFVQLRNFRRRHVLHTNLENTQVQCNKNIKKNGNEGNSSITFSNLNTKTNIWFFFPFPDAQFKPPLHHFYYKPAKLFPHFDYFYNLTRKCIERIEGMEKSEGQSKLLSKDVVIKIGIAGWFSKNNLELISERTGK